MIQTVAASGRTVAARNARIRRLRSRFIVIARRECVTAEAGTAPPRSRASTRPLRWRRLSASIRPRSVKPASSFRSAGGSPSRMRYSSRIQNGASRPRRPSAATGTVSCSRHQASARRRRQVRHRFRRRSGQRHGKSFFPEIVAQDERLPAARRGRIAGPRQHREVEIDADGAAVLQPDERLALDEGERGRPDGDRVGDAADGHGLRAEIRPRPTPAA